MRRTLLLAPLLGALACGGGTQVQARGAAFALSSKEIGLATEYERGDPRPADAQERCDYWTKRREDANGNHVIGLFSWPPSYFEGLRAWTEAKKGEACDAAKADADAKAAKLNEEARVAALEEARREHETRDERAWAAAKASECAMAATEGACDGLTAYLAIVPNGQHASEAATALQLARPKLLELRQRREEGDRQRAVEAVRLEEAAGFRVSNPRAVLDDASEGGPTSPGRYLKVAFDVTAVRAIARGVTPIVRAACQVEDKRMVDVDAALDPHLYELAPGDTKEIDAAPYLKKSLLALPSRCDVVILKATGLEATGSIVHSFCFVPGQGIGEGGCAP
jgi:hypothetical protein